MGNLFIFEYIAVVKVNMTSELCKDIINPLFGKRKIKLKVL